MAPDGCATIPELHRAKNKLLLGIRLDFILNGRLDVVLQVRPDLTGVRLRTPVQNNEPWTLIQVWVPHTSGHEFELFGPNQNVERAWTITAPAVLPAHHANCLECMCNIRPIENKGIDIFLLGAQHTCICL